MHLLLHCCELGTLLTAGFLISTVRANAVQQVLAMITVATGTILHAYEGMLRMHGHTPRQSVCCIAFGFAHCRPVSEANMHKCSQGLCYPVLHGSNGPKHCTEALLRAKCVPKCSVLPC